VTSPLATIIAFPIVLGLLILVHEIGHFTSAKLIGVRVFEFGLGFPPRVAKVVRGETTYSLNALPLGGFVKMMGENGEDAGDPRSFGAKPAWMRGIILVAGPAMNIALALVLFFTAAVWLGAPVATNVVGSVQKHSPAQRAGLRHDDIIVAVAGTRTRSLAAIHKVTEAHLGKRISLTILRSGRRMIVYVRPRLHPPANQGSVGVIMAVREQRYSVQTAAIKSFEGVGAMVMAIPNLIASIGSHGTQNISGPVGIARMTGESASSIPQEGLGQFFAFVALLSANLGVLNLLPIPALDGGRLALVIVAGIRRRNLNPEVEGLIHLVGMAILFTLILVISYQDIIRWASGQ